MAEELTRKKCVRAGHRASATRIITRVDELIAADGRGEAVDLSRLPSLKMNLQEKLDVLKALDGEVLGLVELLQRRLSSRTHSRKVFML